MIVVSGSQSRRTRLPPRTDPISDGLTPRPPTETGSRPRPSHAGAQITAKAHKGKHQRTGQASEVQSNSRSRLVLVRQRFCRLLVREPRPSSLGNEDGWPGTHAWCDITAAWEALRLSDRWLGDAWGRPDRGRDGSRFLILFWLPSLV